MRLLLEGPDGGGKTTLAQDLDWPTASYGEEAQKYEFLFNAIFNWPKTELVIDRFHLSEPVYSKHYRKKPGQVGVLYRVLERVLNSQGTVVINCLPSWETALENWAQNVENELIKDIVVLSKIYAEYTEIKTFLPMAQYNYEQDDIDPIIDDLLWKSNQSYNQGPGVGWFTPGNVLILADRTSDIGQHEVPFSRYRTGCSAWFCGLLEEADIDECQLYWANAHNLIGTEYDPSYIDVLKPKVIIALGARAAEYCSKHRFQCIRFDHPQYHKRFYSKREYPLISYLKGLQDETSTT